MAELDSIPQKQSVEIETVKLDETTINSIKELNQILQSYVVDFGEIHLRRKELFSEIERLDTFQKESENNFEAKNKELKGVLDALDDKYPQGRINLQEGTIVYQPGVPSRKQLSQQPKGTFSAPK